MVVFNHNKLRGRLVEYGYTQQDFAQLLGISQSTVSMKLNNVTDFTSGEIFHIAEVLNIPREEIGDYFFTPKVD